MNTFDEKFFSKYVPEGQEIRGVIHTHMIGILIRLFLWICMGVILPSFIYYYSNSIRGIIPFFVLEVHLYIIFIKINYDVFDWYNDVWIIGTGSVVELEWSLFKKNVITVGYDNIEGMEVEKNGVADTVLKKGDLVLHKIGEDVFALEDASRPEEAMDNIEIAINDYREGNVKPDKFEIMVDKLGGIVEDYMYDKKYKEMIERENLETRYEKINKVQGKSGTVDLR